MWEERVSFHYTPGLLKNFPKWVCTILLIMISTVCIIYCPLESKPLRSDHKVSQGMFLDFGGIWRGKKSLSSEFLKMVELLSIVL